MRSGFLSCFFLLCFVASSQDSAYARQVIRYLTSKQCFGRGYVKSGLATAEKFICAEIKSAGARPLFPSGYTQSFNHPVNTFPGKVELKLNGQKLVTGIDYILDPSSAGKKGKFRLTKKDSITFVSNGAKPRIVVELKNKLTYSVGREQVDFCTVEVNKNRFRGEPSEIAVRVKATFRKDFESRNIGCFIEGSGRTDSMVVFSAHYDHLGGLGSKTFFPGANDNASGVSLVLDLLRFYSKNPPRYRTVFLFFAGEEAGLVGSKFFVENRSADLSKIKFLINLDLLGTGDDGIMVVNGAVHEKAFATLKRINAEKNFVREVRKRGKAANSDHYWFSEAGVPAFFIYTLGGVTAYHDVQDVAETLPLTDYMDVFRLITAFVYTI